MNCGRGPEQLSDIAHINGRRREWQRPTDNDGQYGNHFLRGHTYHELVIIGGKKEIGKRGAEGRFVQTELCLSSPLRAVVRTVEERRQLDPMMSSGKTSRKAK